jgi:hypothetical protein
MAAGVRDSRDAAVNNLLSTVSASADDEPVIESLSDDLREGLRVVHETEASRADGMVFHFETDLMFEVSPQLRCTSHTDSSINRRRISNNSRVADHL